MNSHLKVRDDEPIQGRKVMRRKRWMMSLILLAWNFGPEMAFADDESSPTQVLPARTAARNYLKPPTTESSVPRHESSDKSDSQESGAAAVKPPKAPNVIPPALLECLKGNQPKNKTWTQATTVIV